jgi:Bacterial Ig domain
MNRPHALLASVLFLVLSTGVMAQIFNPFDNDPPIVDITSHPHESDVPVNADWVTVTVVVTDFSPTTVWVAGEPSLETTLGFGGGTKTWNVPLSHEGINSVLITAVDAWGNMGSDVILVTKDTMAPVIVGLSPGPGAVLSEASFELALRIIDVSWCDVSITGVPSSGFGSVKPGGIVTGTISLEHDGVTGFLIRAEDSAGNVRLSTFSAFWDATAPKVTITSPAVGTTFGPGEQSIVVSVLVQDASVTQVVSSPPGISAAIVNSTPASGTFTLVEGANTIAVTATDSVGQIGQAFLSVTLDTTPPVITLESPAGGASVRGVIDLHASAVDVLPGSGVARIDVLVDGSLHASVASASHEGSFDTKTLADGMHEFSVVAVDGKGNTSSTSVMARVDNTLPMISIVDPAEASIRSGNVAFTATASDAGSGIASIVMLAGGSAPTVDGSFTHATPVASDVRTSQVATTMLPDGSLLLSATARDAAGNEATASITIVVDNTAPVKKLIRPLDGVYVKEMLLVEASAEDPNLASLGLFIDDVLVSITTSTSLTTAIDTTTALDGPAHVKIVAMDLGGNISISSAKITLDNLSVKLDPQTLNLKSKGGANSVTARVTGVNAGLLMPTESKSIELRVPGGSPVPSTTGWVGDDALGSEGGVPCLDVKFDRQALIASIRAGLASGKIAAGEPARVALLASGRVIDTVSVRLSGE